MDINQLERIQRSWQYVMRMRPVFNMEALFSDETENYVMPMEPEPHETVTIRFRTAKNNVDAVFFISGADRLLMQFEESRGEFDYFKIEIIVGANPIHYYFEIQTGKFRCFYNKRGVSRNLQEYYAFALVPGFKTPDWAKAQ